MRAVFVCGRSCVALCFRFLSARSGRCGGGVSAPAARTPFRKGRCSAEALWLFAGSPVLYPALLPGRGERSAVFEQFGYGDETVALLQESGDYGFQRGSTLEVA